MLLQLPPRPRAVSATSRWHARPTAVRSADLRDTAARRTNTCYRGSICLPACKPGEELCEDDCCPKGAECATLPLPAAAAPAESVRRSVPAARPAVVSTAVPRRAGSALTPVAACALHATSVSSPAARSAAREGAPAVTLRRGSAARGTRPAQVTAASRSAARRARAPARPRPATATRSAARRARSARRSPAGRARYRLRGSEQVHVLSPGARGVLRRRRRRRVLPGRIPLARRQVHPASGRRRGAVLSRGQAVRPGTDVLRNQFQPRQRFSLLQRQMRLALLRLRQLRRVRRTLRSRHPLSGGHVQAGLTLLRRLARRRVTTRRAR